MGQSAIQLGKDYLQILQQWKGSKSFDLNIIKQIMEYFGHPQDKIKTVHVGGTNGKGSVCANISTILNEAGYRVGLTISPHLNSINERIILEGEYIQIEMLYSLANELRKCCEKLRINPSQHEALTAIAFISFKMEKLDFGVIEVGLGGRLDSSNVIKKPELSIITNIGLDHQEILGIGYEKISFEKAGIIKPNTPVVIGHLNSKSKKVIKNKCVELAAPLYSFKKEFYITNVSSNKYIFNNQRYEFEINPSLLGKHQVENSAIAVQSCLLLDVPKQRCIDGVSKVFWPCRLEIKFDKNNNLILFDCAHNKEGFESLKNFLCSKHFKEIISSRNTDKNNTNKLNIALYFGAVKNKPWKEMLNEIRDYVNEWNLIEPENERAENSLIIKEYLSCMGINNISILNSMCDAKEKIQNTTSPINLVAGSMYMVGKLKAQLFDVSKEKIWTKVY